jgi:hypothetical protein
MKKLLVFLLLTLLSGCTIQILSADDPLPIKEQLEPLPPAQCLESLQVLQEEVKRLQTQNMFLQAQKQETAEIFLPPAF